VITPTHEYRRISYRFPPKLLKGVDAALNSVIGVYHRRSRILERLEKDAALIDDLAPRYQQMSSHNLQEELRASRQHFRRGGNVPAETLFSALAAIREAADRQLGLRPFVVQLMGALALHRGFLAEMATGEGKTLTAGLAAVLAGWSQRPCHIVTVNDYLVQRDAEWLKALYSFSGVRVGCVTAAMNPLERRQGYACEVTYATSKELLADFLRDRLQLGGLSDPSRRLIRSVLSGHSARDGLVMRGLHTAIVDEADSVLIDEAVTPLIISAPRKNETLHQAVETANEIIAPFERDTDYTVNLRYREVEVTESGRKKIESQCASLNGIWKGPERRLELIRQALTAREFFHSGKQYVIDQEKIVIVDEFTGRPMPQRSWRQGMHQAIEAKEGVPISDPSETIARLSFQRFFRLFHHVSGMTGTAYEARHELWQIYRLPVITIPNNRPCIRRHLPDRLFADEESKWQAVAGEIVRIHATGRPLLVGTRNVAASERLGAMLSERGLHFRLLNAVRHQEEAQIIAEAGIAEKITISTNMAGRGTDIKLGKGVADMGGLHVIATERHESGRVDRQLFGRSARQGDPGSAQAFVSTEDELLRRFLPSALHRNLTGAFRSGIPGGTALARAALTRAQMNAQKIAYRQRLAVLKMDDWLEESLSFAGSSSF
jgi:preprotein translocase subunit SecA